MVAVIVAVAVTVVVVSVSARQKNALDSILVVDAVVSLNSKH